MRPPSLLIAAALQHCVLDARVTFVGAQVLYANEARNAADREIDCSDISAVLADVNEKCCNGGRASSSQTGHRRAQGSSETCVLDTCTPACAEVFVGMMTDCNDQLPTMGSQPPLQLSLDLILTENYGQQLVQHAGAGIIGHARINI